MASPLKYRVTRGEGARDDSGAEDSSVVHGNGHTSSGAWSSLALMAVLSFLAMYALMYAMVHTWPDVLNNYNQVNMAGLMTAPMVLIELVVMRQMYPSSLGRSAVAILMIGLGVACWIGIRQQFAIGNQQFLRSMIPHHSGAILMCEKGKFDDAEIRTLCQSIMDGQRREIDTMRQLLRKYEG